MSIRELLQTQLWSKRTTWILLIGIVALIGLGQLGCYTAERFYLSRADRNAAREALKEIDRLQNSGALADDVFAAEARAADLKVRNAERVEWTERDIGVNFLLLNYFYSIQTERILAKKHLVSSGSQEDPAKQRDQWQARMQQSATKQKSRLHQLLD